MVYFGTVAIISMAFFGLIMTYIMFKYFFDPIFGKIQRSIKKEWSRSPAVAFRIGQEKSSRYNKPELERFIHEEYDSSNHDIVAVVISTANNCVGVAAFFARSSDSIFL